MKKKKIYKWMIPTLWRNGKKLRFVDYRINKEGVLKRIITSKRWKAGKIIKGYIHPNGYVYVQPFVNGVQYLVPIHRLVWETFVGRIPKGYQINHNNSNGNKTLNKLSKLECVTPKENVKHGIDNGFLFNEEHNKKISESKIGKFLSKEHREKISIATAGEKNPGAKLSQDQVDDIRYSSYVLGIKDRDLSNQFGVSEGCIYNIISCRSWNPDRISRYKMKDLVSGIKNS